MQSHMIIMWLPILLAFIAWHSPLGVSGQLPEDGPLDVVVCDNRSDSFSICWSPSDSPSVSGYCSYLRNTFGFVSEDNYHPQPRESTSQLEYSFGRLGLISTYRGCVFPVPDLVKDDEDCAQFEEEGRNVSCASYTPDPIGWNFQSGLAVGCAGYLILMYVLLRIATIVCPYSRRSLSYEDFLLQESENLRHDRGRGNRGSEKQRRKNSIKERARKRSEAISEVLTSPPKSPRSPSTLSEISETDSGTDTRKKVSESGSLAREGRRNRRELKME